MIQHERVESRTRHVQARTLAITGLAAILLARDRFACSVARSLSCNIASGLRGLRWLVAIVVGTRGNIGCRCHLMMSHSAAITHMSGAVDRRGMAQLADDQAAHQHENKRPALPEELTHRVRVTV